jgi:hypothetical protein
VGRAVSEFASICLSPFWGPLKMGSRSCILRGLPVLQQHFQGLQMVFPFRLSQKARSNPHLCALFIMGASEPSNYYAIIVDKQNISSHSCIFDGPVYGPTFYPDRVSGDRPFALCYDCKIPLAQRDLASANTRSGPSGAAEVSMENCTAERRDTMSSTKLDERPIIIARRSLAFEADLLRH